MLIKSMSKKIKNEKRRSQDGLNIHLPHWRKQHRGMLKNKIKLNSIMHGSLQQLRLLVNDSTTISR
jgi:hypothetical protein